MNLKIKKYEVPLYLSLLFILTLGVLLGESIINNKSFSTKEETKYVDNEITDYTEYIPVITEEITLIKPFLEDTISISKKYYNYQDESTNQEESLIYYENTYMQNTGVAYKNSTSFDVVSILDGTVIDVSENEILGKTIKIRHTNNLISIYQSMGEISVNKDDEVLRGQIIGKSGTCNLYKEDYNLHFELYLNGLSINPEENYNKRLEELK